MLSFLPFFNWKAIYKNVFKGLYKRIENNWNCRSSLPVVVCKKSGLRNFAKCTGKHLRQGFLFNKVAGLKPLALLKKRPWHMSFPVNFLKLLRAPFPVQHHWQLLLGSFLGCQSMWYFNKNTIFSRMNIIFFGDTGDITPRCIFSGQEHPCFVFFARRAMSCF